LRSGRLIKTAVNWPVAFRIAAQLSERHSAVIGTRSLDVLHIAAAKTLGAVELLSFDTRQRTLAATLGLSTSP
jgi:predicted nucleic acid-binding protein